MKVGPYIVLLIGVVVAVVTGINLCKEYREYSLYKTYKTTFADTVAHVCASSDAAEEATRCQALLQMIRMVVYPDSTPIEKEALSGLSCEVVSQKSETDSVLHVTITLNHLGERRHFQWTPKSDSNVLMLLSD